MKKIYLVILVGILLLFIVIAAYVFGSRQSDRFRAATTENPQVSPEQMISGVPSVFPSITVVSQQEVVVVIENEGTLQAQDVTEIRARVISPFIDFKNESQPGQLVSLKVAPNLLESKAQYPYSVDAIFKNGANESFLISKTADGHISWYIPDCLNGCNFSDEFSAKYPEIVELSN